MAPEYWALVGGLVVIVVAILAVGLSLCRLMVDDE